MIRTRQSCPAKILRKLLTISALVVTGAEIVTAAQNFFPLKDVHPGLHGIGRTVFEGNRIEEFQVEILGVIENIGPKQAIILARLSGGPLEQTGVLQGMSGSPVYIDGKLVGAIALGFPFSKQPIAGIQPIGQMIADADFSSHSGDALDIRHNAVSWGEPATIPKASRVDLPIGNL